MALEYEDIRTSQLEKHGVVRGDDFSETLGSSPYTGTGIVLNVFHHRVFQIHLSRKLSLPVADWCRNPVINPLFYSKENI